MERGGVFIYRFDDDQPDQVTQAAAVTLPSTEVSALQLETALDALEAPTRSARPSRAGPSRRNGS